MIKLLAAAFLLVPTASHAASFTPYDVHGMSYLYGIAVGDFGNGPQAAYSDSLTPLRTMYRQDDAIIYLHDIQNGPTPIYVEDMSFHPTKASLVPKLIERMVAFDVNEDGLNDIVAVANSHDAVVAYINPGPSGTWTRQVLTMSTPGAVNLILADFDGDGKTDIAVSMRNQTMVYPAAKPGVGWLRNLGGGNFTYADIQVNAGLNEPRGLMAIDIFQDGTPELIVTDPISGAVRAFRYVGSPSWVSYNVAGVNGIGSFYNVAHDVNGDGIDDLVFGRSDGIYWANVSWNILNPPVTKLNSFGVGVASSQVGEIVVSDITGDGVAELVYALPYNGLMYSQKSGGSWTAHLIAASAEKYLSLNVMDFDGDGKMDILAGMEYPRNTLQVWHQGP